MNRILPCDLTAESVVLGTMLMGNPDAANELITMLAAEDFYDPGHAQIWAAMQEVHGASQTVDFVTVASRMAATGGSKILSARGGDSYLIELSNSVPIYGGAHHVRLVKDASILRKIVFLCDRYRMTASEAQTSPADTLAALQREAGELADRGIAAPVKRLKPLLNQAIGILENRYNHKQAIVGVPTGLCELDGKTGGYRCNEITVLAARPSMGKTAFIVGNIIHAAISGYPTLFFSVEMSAESITERIISNDGHVNSVGLQTGYLTTPDWTRIYASTARLSTVPVDVDDSPRQTLASIETKARKWRRDKAAFPTGEEKGLIAIDYLQLLKPPEQRWGEQKRHVALGDITKGLKALAKELKVAIVILSQLNRELEKRADKRPMQSDLAESGSIEADADVIIFLYRDEKYNPKTTDVGVAEVIIAKQRNGPTGTVKVKFFEAETRFADLSFRSGM